MFYEVDQKPVDQNSVDMRFGSNKKNSIDPVNLIMNFLLKYPYSTLAEIFKYLKRSKSTYSKKAISLMLQKLEKELKIKNTESKGKHPKYDVIDTSEFTIKRDGYAFKDQICANELENDITSNEFDTIKSYPDDYAKRTISESIFKFGMISFYTCLVSYRRSMSPKNNPEKNKELHELWLRNAMSFENNIKNYQKFSDFLDSKLRCKLDSIKSENKLNEKSTANEEDMDYSTEEITQKEILNSVKEIENTFSEMFPEWYEGFKGDEDLIDNQVYDLMREVCINHSEYLLK